MMTGAKAQNPKAPKARAKARRRGVALFWLITILGAVGTLFAAKNLSEEAAQTLQEHDRRQQLRTDNIATALNDYALDRADIERMPLPLPAQPGVAPIPRLLLLPCPDNLSDTGGADGLQDATCGSATVHVALNGGARLGLLPWNSALSGSGADPGLGYPFTDGTGNNFWYAVARNVAPSTNRTRPLNLHHLANATTGWLTVGKISPQGELADTSTRVAAVVIAPGASRTARIPLTTDLSGQINGATRAGGELDKITGGTSGSPVNYNNSDNDNEFVEAPRTGDFNDRVEFISAEEWWQEGGDFVRRYEEKVGITPIHNAPAPGSPLEKVRQMIVGYHSLLNYYPLPAKNTMTVITTTDDRVAPRFHTGANSITVFTTPLLASVTTTTYLLMTNYGIHATLTSQTLTPVVGQVQVFIFNTITLDAGLEHCVPNIGIGCPERVRENPTGLTVTGGMTITTTVTSTVSGGTLRTAGRRINVADLPLTIGEISPNGVYIEIVFSNNSAMNRLFVTVYRGTNPLLGSVGFQHNNRRPETTTLTLIAPDRRLRNIAVADVTAYMPGDPITVLAAQPITATISSNASIVIDDMSILTSIRGTVAGATIAVTCGPMTGGTRIEIGPGSVAFTANVDAGRNGFDCNDITLTVTTTVATPNVTTTLTICCDNGATAMRDAVTVGDPVTIAQYARYVVAAPLNLATLSLSVQRTTVGTMTIAAVTLNMQTTESRVRDVTYPNYHRIVPCGRGGGAQNIYNATEAQLCEDLIFPGIIARSYATVWTQSSYIRLGVAFPAPVLDPPRDGIENAPLVTVSRSPFFIPLTVASGLTAYNLAFAGSPVSVIPLPDRPLPGQVFASTVHVYQTTDDLCDRSPSGCGGGGNPRYTRGRIRDGDNSTAVGSETWLGRAIVRGIPVIHPMTGMPTVVDGWFQSHEVTIANGVYSGAFAVTGTIVPPITTKHLVPVAMNTPIPAGHILALLTDTTLTLLPTSPLVPMPETELAIGWLPVSEPPPRGDYPLPYMLPHGATGVFLSPASLTSPAMSLVISPEDNIVLPGGFAVMNMNISAFAGNITVNINKGEVQMAVASPAMDTVSYAKRQQAGLFAFFAIADGTDAAGNPVVEAPAVVFPLDRGTAQRTQSRTIYPPVLNKNNYYEPNITDTRLTISIAGKEWVDPGDVMRRTVNTEIPADMQDTAGEFLSITVRHGGTDDLDRPVLVDTISEMAFDLASDIYTMRRDAFNAFVEDHPMHYVVSGDCLYSGYECGGAIAVEVENGATIALPDNYLLTSHPARVTAVSAFVYANDANRTRYTIELFDRGVVRLTPSVTAITIGKESDTAELFQRKRVQNVFVNGRLSAAATLTSIIRDRDSRPSRMFLSNGTRDIEVLLQEGQVIRNDAFFQIDAGTPIIARSDGVTIVGVDALLAFSPAPVTRAACDSQLESVSRTNLLDTVPVTISVTLVSSTVIVKEQVADQTDVTDAEMTDICAWLDTSENTDGDNHYVIEANTGNTFPISRSNDYFIFFGGRPNL